MNAWRITTVDSGTAQPTPREVLRGFSTGDRRTIKRRIDGLPSSPAIASARFTVKQSTRTSTALILKEITSVLSDAGQITVEGGKYYASFILAEADTAKLTRPAVFDADVTLADGSTYTMAYGSISAKQAVSVGEIDTSPVVDHITVTPNPVTVAEGGIVQLVPVAYEADNTVIPGAVFTYDSANEARAIVTVDGQVVGVAAGAAANISVTSGGVTVLVPATVTTKVVSVAITPADTTVPMEGTLQLVATAKDIGGATVAGATVAWSSSDPTKATVSSSGLVTGVATGATTITATVSGVSATRVLTVVIPTATGLEWVPKIDGTSPRYMNALNLVAAARRFGAEQSDGREAMRRGASEVEANTQIYQKFGTTDDQVSTSPADRAPAVNVATERDGPLRYSIAQVMTLPAYDPTLDKQTESTWVFRGLRTTVNYNWDAHRPRRQIWGCVAVAADDAASVGKLVRMRLRKDFTGTDLDAVSPWVRLGEIGEYQWIMLGPYDASAVAWETYPYQMHALLEFPNSTERPSAVRFWNLSHQYGVPVQDPERFFSPLPLFSASTAGNGGDRARGANPYIDDVGWFNAGMSGDALTDSDAVLSNTFFGNCSAGAGEGQVLRPDTLLDTGGEWRCDSVRWTSTGGFRRTGIGIPNSAGELVLANERVQWELHFFVEPGHTLPPTLELVLRETTAPNTTYTQVVNTADRDAYGVLRGEWAIAAGVVGTSWEVEVNNPTSGTYRMAFHRLQLRRSPYAGKRNAFGREAPFFGRRRTASAHQGQQRFQCGPPGCYLTRTKGVFMMRWEHGYWNPLTDLPNSDFSFGAQVGKKLMDAGPNATALETFIAGVKTNFVTGPPTGDGKPFWFIEVANDAGPASWRVGKLMEELAALPTPITFTPRTSHWFAFRWDKTTANGIIDWCIDGQWFTDGISSQAGTDWDFATVSANSNLWLLNDRDLDMAWQGWLKAVRIERGKLLSQATVNAIAASWAAEVP